MSRSKSKEELAEERSRPSDWLVAANATNGVAVVTKAAESGKRHILDGISVSIDGADIGQVGIWAGISNTVTFALTEGQAFAVVTFPRGLDLFGENAQIQALCDGGGADAISRVNIWGRTVVDESAL